MENAVYLFNFAILLQDFFIDKHTLEITVDCDYNANDRLYHGKYYNFVIRL